MQAATSIEQERHATNAQERKLYVGQQCIDDICDLVCGRTDAPAVHSTVLDIWRLEYTCILYAYERNPDGQMSDTQYVLLGQHVCMYVSPVIAQRSCDFVPNKVVRTGINKCSPIKTRRHAHQ